MMKFCAAVLSACLVTVPLGATVMVPVDLGTLAREAGAIVRGRVTSVEGRWRPDRRGVETLVTLQVEARLKGTMGDNVTFVVPGGRLGRFRNVVVGAPLLAPDERVIVFLGHRGPSLPFVLGLSQGLYRVQRHAASWTVAPTVPGASVTNTMRGDPARRPLPLDAFERQVRALAEGR